MISMVNDGLKPQIMNLLSSEKPTVQPTQETPVIEAPVNEEPSVKKDSKRENVKFADVK